MDWRFRRGTKVFKFNPGLLYPSWLLLTHSLTLHLGLALVKRNIALDLVHTRQRIRIVPRRVLDLGLVGRHGVVGRVALVRAMRRGGRGAEMRLGNGVGWELFKTCGLGLKGQKDDGGCWRPYVDVAVDDFPFVRLGDYDAVY
jgi:hypothetical protein